MRKLLYEGLIPINKCDTKHFIVYRFVKKNKSNCFYQEYLKLNLTRSG